MRDSYTNRNHCPSHEMWSYERDGRWCGWSFVRGSTVVLIKKYINIGPTLADDIPISNDTFSTYLTDAVGDTLFLQPVTQPEIINLVNNTKSKKSKYHDDIDVYLVKQLIPYLVIPLEHIFNISLQTGVFPDSMKIARVIPLFKNGNINDFTNYRPISLLSQFSKILENIFHNRMMSFIEEKNILYESQ